MIFNKIESRITNPSSKHIRFAVVSMDDSNAVKESVKKINDCYSDSEMYDVVLIDGFKKSKNDKLSFNLDKVQKDKDLSGVIFLIGTAADDSQSWKSLRMTIDDFSNIRRELPIGYIKNGNKRCFDLHYEEIDSGQLENCIHNLIMRGYARSRMQFELSNAYQFFFWVVIVMITTLYIGVLAGKYSYLKQMDNTKQRYMNEVVQKTDSIRRTFERPDILDDLIYKESEALGMWKTMDLKSDINDATKQILKEASEYYFSDLTSLLFVKLWIRDDKNDSLTCIFNNATTSYGDFSVDIPMCYLVGKVADNKVFFLWPGADNLEDTCFNKKTFAWSWLMEKGNKIRNDRWQKVEERWKWTGEIEVEDKWQNAEIEWSKKDKDKFAAFCFSYDGYLVLEIDCLQDKIKADYDYMANMTFRNSVRKYMKFVYCLLKNNNDKYKKKSM